MNNIFLCGFMGCGKTTVGQQLATLLHYRFVDMDKFIEQKAGMSVSEIFDKFGESHFRVLEQNAARELSNESSLVVGTGGGAVLNPANTAAFKSGGTIVLIDVPIEIIKSRLCGDTTRPLLCGADGDKKLTLLYHERMPVYHAAADIVICNPDDRLETVMAREIADMLNK